MARPKKGEEHAPKNSATDEQALEIIEGIEKEKDGLLALHMDYMRDCQPYHQRVKDIIDRGVKVYGMSRRSIQAKIKERMHLRKADEQRAKLDSEEIEAFDKLSDLLGPLGKAAAAAFHAGRKTSDPLSDLAGASQGAG
jgi:hypothetical protein